MVWIDGPLGFKIYNKKTPESLQTNRARAYFYAHGLEMGLNVSPKGYRQPQWFHLYRDAFGILKKHLNKLECKIDEINNLCAKGCNIIEYRRRIDWNQETSVLRDTTLKERMDANKTKEIGILRVRY